MLFLVTPTLSQLKESSILRLRAGGDKALKDIKANKRATDSGLAELQTESDIHQAELDCLKVQMAAVHKAARKAQLGVDAANAAVFQAASDAHRAEIDSLRQLVAGQCKALKSLKGDYDGLAAALDGNLVFSSLGPLTVDVAAADLNAAKAGELKFLVRVVLESATGMRYSRGGFTPVLAPTVTTVGSAVAPTTDWSETIKFKNGKCDFYLVPDTDVSDWAPGDSFDIPVQIQASDSLLGWTCPPITPTFNVV